MSTANSFERSVIERIALHQKLGADPCVSYEQVPTMVFIFAFIRSFVCFLTCLAVQTFIVRLFREVGVSILDRFSTTSTVFRLVLPGFVRSEVAFWKVVCIFDIFKTEIHTLVPTQLTMLCLPQFTPAFPKYAPPNREIIAN